jgi:hypothetical protein
MKKYVPVAAVALAASACLIVDASPASAQTWTLTGQTWATSAPSGAATYSVQAHPDDSAPGTLLISYAVNGGGQYYPNFISISP